MKEEEEGKMKKRKRRKRKRKEKISDILNFGTGTSKCCKKQSLICMSLNFISIET
jgi:predicted transcriptional regulator